MGRPHSSVGERRPEHRWELLAYGGNPASASTPRVELLVLQMAMLATPVV